MKERDKFLTGAIGEKPQRQYFVSTDVQGGSGDGYYATEGVLNDFSTWEGFGKLWEWAQQQEWFETFCQVKMDDGAYCKGNTHIPAAFIHPNHFADALHEFLGGEK